MYKADKLSTKTDTRPFVQTKRKNTRPTNINPKLPANLSPGQVKGKPLNIQKPLPRSQKEDELLELAKR